MSTSVTAWTRSGNHSCAYLLGICWPRSLTLVPRCSADVSVNVWQWSEHYQAVAGRVNVAHSCRNFNKIKDWVRERLAPEMPFDEFEHVENDLPYPPILHSAAE